MLFFRALLLSGSRWCLVGSLKLRLITTTGRCSCHLCGLGRGSWSGVRIEVVDEHRRILHHALSCHHEPGLHLVQQGALLLVVLAVLKVTIVTGARVAEATRHVRVYVDALLTVGALGEKLALFFRVHILTLVVWLATFGPVLAADQNFLAFRLSLGGALLWISHSWACRFKCLNWLDRAEPLQTFTFELLCLLCRELRFNELAVLTACILVRRAVVVLMADSTNASLLQI